ncbi:hypothetical protein Poli38472_002268 [Pythium oligandrum]|uniref:Serine/threonine-protein phosphatase PGAM5, mitochondrial n=1 Tax=Pythium oligandrum TaxID=41045 RepID=A0A8K1CJG0_PYTOL|nr:hypothetical protein Poli38472_002268 [Pythium oligandrum]|eukprot:TMW63327.1 hypothetical protein Poli38472_002268 [Pythium oligandrum]
MPREAHDYYKQHAVASAYRHKVDVEAVTKQLKTVQFSDNNGMELERLQHTEATHHPTPQNARSVIHSSTSKRLAAEEIELMFSDDAKFRVSSEDYVVSKIANRNEYIIASFVHGKEVKLGISRPKTYWAELYNGVLMLHKFHKKDNSVDKKREPVPIGGCKLKIADMKECLMEIHYTYQGHPEVKALRFATKPDMFLWWWAIHLASVSRYDSRLLQQAMQRRQTTMSPFQFLDPTVENVFFSRPARAPASQRRPSVTHLILIRHAEAENMQFRVPDSEKKLTTRGRGQAQFTAKHIAEMLKTARADGDNVSLIYSGLQRSVETAKEFKSAMPWLKRSNSSCLLEDGAPESIEATSRQDFRAAMHRMAWEYICRFDPTEHQHGSGMKETYKVMICHASLVQHCLSQTHQIAKEVVRMGAPIAHCSVTQIDILNDGDRDRMETAFVNRVQHLPLTYRTSE